jgi:1,4-alpha-glucan branching enzyme
LPCSPENTPVTTTTPQLVHEDKGAHILAFRRAGLLFVFNFHPVQSHTGYGIPTEPGKYRILLDTDHPSFGGFGLIDDRQIHFTGPLFDDPSTGNRYLKLYLPARSALVLEKIPTPSLLDLL